MPDGSAYFEVTLMRKTENRKSVDNKAFARRRLPLSLMRRALNFLLRHSSVPIITGPGSGGRGADGFLNVLRRKLRDISALTRADIALRESEARNRLLICSAKTGLWEWNILRNEVCFSPEWKLQLGFADHEFRNSFDEWEKRIHAEDLARTLQAREDLLAGRSGDYEIEFRLLHRDGSWRWFVSRADLDRDTAGRPVRVMGCDLDVTERKRMEEALRTSEERYRALVEWSPDAICVHRDGKLLFVNPAAIQIFGGKSPQDLRGSPTVDLVRADFLQILRSRAETAAADSAALPMIAELRRSREDLRALARRIDQIREEQLATMARELHDELAQTLCILHLHVRSMQKQLEEYTGKSPGFANREALELIEHATHAVRYLCAKMRPPTLDLIGLRGALQTLAGDFESRSRIRCLLSAEVEIPTLDAPREITVYRIVQELLTNVVRHSGASEARIALRADDGALEIEVADNGRGITAAEASDGTGFGLLGMRERALAVGGSIRIEGRPDGGTKAVARIPVNLPRETP